MQTCLLDSLPAGIKGVPDVRKDWQRWYDEGKFKKKEEEILETGYGGLSGVVSGDDGSGNFAGEGKIHERISPYV